MDRATPLTWVPTYIVAVNGDVYRVVTGHLGSLSRLVNTTDTVAARSDQDVRGRVKLASGGHSLHAFGYAGDRSGVCLVSWAQLSAFSCLRDATASWAHRAQ